MFERVFQHRTILADKVRLEAYQKGIHEVVKEGDVVADIGTGSGILTFFALQAGARKVYAIEQNKIIKEAEELAKINGLEKKIVFVRGRSDRVELPEKVDVITSELIGHFGLEENLLHFKINARERFLKPGGRLVPAWLELHLVPVEAEKIWKENIELWDSDYYGVDFSPVRNCAVSQRYVTNCTNKAIRLAAPSVTSHINFYEIEKIPFVFQGKFIISKKGKFHGLVGYFEAGLSPGVVLSASFENALTHWKQNFFPVEDVVMVDDGDEVHYKIKAISQTNEVYWQWDTSVYRKGKKIAGFSQSNLQISKEELVLGRTSFRPSLSQGGKVRRRVLELCDGTRSIKEISQLIYDDYPAKYKDLKQAIQEVVGIVRQVVEI
jgi:predicted RNA methylase